jgi:hypothetical protein
MNVRRGFLTAIAIAALAGPAWAAAPDMPPEYREVLATLGRNGDYADGVLKLGLPRADLAMTVGGIPLPTSYGFAGWLGFARGNHGMDVMMGDIVLLQEEVNPVISALLENGLEVTALHNHFFWDSPRVYYAHVHGHGKSADLARKIKPALDLLGHIPRMEDAGDTASASGKRFSRIVGGTINTAALDALIGHPGLFMGSVYKYTIGRDDIKLKEMGAVINARMGFNTWAAFLGSDTAAVIAGDVAMLADEVTPVLKALRKHGLDVVSIHHHMTGTSPMIIFLHYWGEGPAPALASGFRAALDELGKSRRNPAHGMTHGGNPAALPR